MAILRCSLCLALLAGAFAASSSVTPIEKVITLIEGLKKEVEDDGKAEAKSYEEFACFCKDTTDEKSTSVKDGEDKINVLSSDIADKTQEQKDDASELATRKKDHEDLNNKLDESIARHAKDKAEYEAENADLSKAIQGLEDALKSMKGSKPASFLSVRESLGKTFEMAEALNLLVAPKHKAVAAFIQQSSSVDPSDPEYKFHSQDIIDVCDELLVDYKKELKELNEEWQKTDKAAKALQASLRKELGSNADAMKQLKASIEKLAKEIADHRSDLVISQGQMQDDELYLKDLQAQCEQRANDYDQRSAMRGDELAALTGALKVLKNDVKDETEVNVRALLLQKAVAPGESFAKQMTPVVTKASDKAISFLQGSSTNAEARETKKTSALDVLRKEGQRIGSLALISLAERSAADPFKKVKGLIQKLIERLLEESKNEASKKGFCDTELGKARKDRDFRFTEANDLSADLEGLEAKRDALVEEIKVLKKEIKDETKALKETTKEREEEKKANMKTLKTAKEGLDGVNEALLILKSFYKQAAKAALIQKASPLDEDTKGAGFEGNYKGKQGASQAIFSLLETIVSDFDRTLRKTQEAEDAAHREYVKFSQAAQASIAGKTTKKELDEEDLETTYTSIKQKTDDMQTAVDLLDSALKELEELKPTCIDTGMSYGERVKKREEEMKALKVALCILDDEGVEPECS
jgi:DNA repair exonuclease SbcCD ATPase subunit